MNADKPVADQEPVEKVEERKLQALDAYLEALQKGQEVSVDQVLPPGEADTELRKDLELLKELYQDSRLLDLETTVTDQGPYPLNLEEGDERLPPGTLLGECVIEELVVQGRDHKLELPPAWRFTPEEGLHLRGQFNRPVYWYLVWIDSAGKPTIRHGTEETTFFEYPPPRDGKPRVVRPSPKDPKGTHLLLLLAGSLPPEKAAGLLKATFDGTGKPPPVAWAGQVRGPEEIPLAAPFPPIIFGTWSISFPKDWSRSTGYFCKPKIDAKFPCVPSTSWRQ